MLALAAVAALTMVCNLIGYGGNLAESIPGMVILCFISLLGLTAKELLPTSLPAVTYIGVIGMLAAMPASPIAEPIIYWTDKIDVMASITPILAFACCSAGKRLESLSSDWLERRSGIGPDHFWHILCVRLDCPDDVIEKSCPRRIRAAF